MIKARISNYIILMICLVLISACQEQAKTSFPSVDIDATVRARVEATEYIKEMEIPATNIAEDIDATVQAKVEATQLFNKMADTSPKNREENEPDAISENMTSGNELIKSVESYWENVSNEWYEDAWSGLTPTFKQRMHEGSYSNYVAGYEDMQICSIQADKTRLISSNDDFAIVSAEIIYHNRIGCNRSVHKFDHFLVYDFAQGKWLLEGVDYRDEEITDKHISKALDIRSKANSGSIRQSQAEKELENIAVEVGKEAFTWIVRHVPIYDSNTGWQTFDDYAKDLTQSSDVNEDARFYQDPVGVSVDLFFGNYDSSDIIDWLGIDD